MAMINLIEILDKSDIIRESGETPEYNPCLRRIGYSNAHVLAITCRPTQVQLHICICAPTCKETAYTKLHNLHTNQNNSTYML